MTVHLAITSSFTLMKSTVRIRELVSDLSAKGYRACALTDHHVLYGAAAFIRECNSKGIHPIIGMEVSVLYHEETVPFLLLCRDNRGYQNLLSLSSLLMTGERDSCTTEELMRFLPGCHLIAYGEGGWADSELVSENYEEADRKLQIMKEELGITDVALSYQEATLWKNRNVVLKRLCMKNGIHTVALNRVCYLHPEDAYAYRVMSAIDRGVFLTDASLPNIQGRHLLSKQEMAALYEEDDLKRTDEIAEMCTADYRLPVTGLPSYPLSEGVKAEDYLRSLSYAGLKKRRNGHPEEKYIARLKYELDVIIRMGFCDYFLIVYDFIRYGRTHGIYIGPGRGSAAGSLVSYCLGITMVDPMQYNLLFERFLNPERVTLPDIDTDIPDNRREELISYVYEKYGHDHVCSIITFGTFGARQSLRDVAKVIGVPEREADALVRMIPNRPKITLSRCYGEEVRFRQMIDSQKELQRLYQTACMLEGLPRHTSIHAAGIIMSRLPLEQIVPTISLNEGMKTSQFTMDFLEERGLIKMDFLGLRNLSIIDEIVHEIQKKNPSFQIMKIDIHDADTYRVFHAGDTNGIFQFESEGMKNLLRRMHPRDMEDIACAMALYRPGASMHIPEYLRNRKNPEEIPYLSEELKPVLSPTCGIMIYQEQVMSVAQKMAGFSLADADLLRRAISKKKEDVMQALKGRFVRGCMKNGHSEKTAEQLYDLIEKFAGYGFNKSHAIAYSYIAYQLAWLKCHYPLAFYTALLNGCIGDSKKTGQYIDECRKRKISICYPDVNVSQDVAIHDEASITLPLTDISSIGSQIAHEIMSEREKNGPYQNYFDFVARTSIHRLSKSHMENLIDAGALDCFEYNRATMKAALDDALRYSDLVRIEKNGQISINLNLISQPAVIRQAENDEEKNENERRVFGFTLGPSIVARLRQENHIRTPLLSTISQQTGSVEGFAVIRSAREYRTRKGSMMAFCEIADETASLEMRVMPRQYERYSSVLIRGSYILFHAKMTEEDYLIADEIRLVRKGGRQ